MFWRKKWRFLEKKTFENDQKTILKISEKKDVNFEERKQENFEPKEHPKTELVLCESPPQTSMKLSQKPLIKIYENIFKYGCLSHSQICQILDKSSEAVPQKIPKLKKVDFFQEKIYFHTKASLKSFSDFSSYDFQELCNHVVFFKKNLGSELTKIILEIEVLLIIEKFLQKSKSLSLYDWFSRNNPRRKLSFDTKNSSFDLLLIFNTKKSQKRYVVIKFLNEYKLFTPGESLEKYIQVIKQSKEEILKVDVLKHQFHISKKEDLQLLFVLPDSLKNMGKTFDKSEVIILKDFLRSPLKSL